MPRTVTALPWLDRVQETPRRQQIDFNGDVQPKSGSQVFATIQVSKSEVRSPTFASEVHDLPVYCQALLPGVHKMLGSCVNAASHAGFGTS